MAYGLMFATRGKKSGRSESNSQGTFWRVTILESGTSLRICRSIEKLEAQASFSAMRLLQERCLNTSPPPMSSDGGSGCQEAMLEVYGQIPQPKGRGRHPQKKAAAADWKHLKIVKNKNALSETGQNAKPVRKVVFGDSEEVLLLLAKGTVKVERTHLTMRLSNARLTRKTLGYSKKLENHKLSAAWEDLFYNFANTVRTLKIELPKTDQNPKVKRFSRRWMHRSPAMAAGLADHVWSVKELLYAIPIHQHLSG